MRLSSLASAVFFAAILGCASSAPDQMGMVPTNIRTFTRPYGQVWKAVIDTIRYDYLMQIDVADQKRGYFSTELVRDYQSGQKTKFRVSGTIAFDGQGTIVKLYKHQQVENNDTWKTIPSDLSLETKILDIVGKKLPPIPAKK